MIYFIDGSREAFLTAFLRAFYDENALITSSQCQLTLGQETIFINADPDIAQRVLKRFVQLDKKCIKELDYLLRSGDKRREQIAFGYFMEIAKNGCPVRNMLANPAVLAAEECIRKISAELDRMYGFVRFMESASGALYAPISPDNDISDLLLPHFCARLPEYPFVIHDVPRHKAAIYDGKNRFCAPLDHAEIVLSADEEAWKTLWQRYYRAVNIPSRERLKQMRGYLPVRYWKFMPEFQDSEQSI